MKKLLCCAVLTAVILAGCKQPSAGKGKNMPKPSSDEKPTLVSMFIHGVEVKKGKVTVSNEKIVKDNIKAKFSYGGIKDKELEVAVKGLTFIVDKAKPKTLELSVPAVKGEYAAWSGSVEVLYSSVPPLIPVSIKIHGVKVVNNKVSISKETVKAENIEAKFSYGSVTEEKIEVTVKDSPFTVDKAKPKTLELSVPAVKGKYAAWEAEIEVSFEEEMEDSKELITKAGITGSYEQGVLFAVAQAQMQKLFSGEDVTIEMKGPYAAVLLGSNKVTWSKLVINGKDVPFSPYPALGFKSAVLAGIKLPESGGTEEISIKVEGGTKRQRLSFKIKRMEGTVDVPYLKLFLVGKDVITNENRPKLQDGSKPSFKGTEPCAVEVQCANDDAASITIDGNQASIKTKNLNGKDIYYAEASVKGISPSGKDVEIKIAPKNTADYHEVKWNFRLEYQASQQMNVVYTFNNKPRRLLPKTFTEALEKGEKPTLQLENGSYLNMEFDAKAALSEVKVNDVSFTGQALIAKGVGHVFRHSMPAAASGTDVKVVLIPKDSGKYAEKIFEFKVKGGGNKEKLEPSLTINGINDFPDEFKNHLTDGQKPLHKVFKSPAKIEIDFEKYAFLFLTEKVKINNEEIPIKEVKKGLRTFYKAEKEIAVSDSEAEEITIEFMPKVENMFDPLIWQFKLQGGAEKPPIPKEKITLFINGVGGYGEPLPKEFTEHITDNTNPLHTVDSSKAAIRLAWYKEANDIIEKTVFEFDNLPPVEVQAAKHSNAWVCDYEAALADTEAHNIVIKIVPKPEVLYKELVYKFRIKNTGAKPQMPLRFGVENINRQNGYQAEIDTDMPIIHVTSEEDNSLEIMDEVFIDNTKAIIRKMPVTYGEGYYFEALHAVEIPADSYKDIIIRVTPKDTNIYRETSCTFKLKAKAALPKNNGKFKYNGEYAEVKSDIEWVNSEKREADNDYGAKNVLLTFNTESPHTKVKYKSVVIIENDDDTIKQEFELEDLGFAEHIGTKHFSKKIILLPNIPVTIKAEVVPDEGTADPDKGIWYLTYNPVRLKWDYADKNTNTEYTCNDFELETSGSDKIIVIKADKAKITGNKLYFALSAWQEEFGVNIADGAFTFTKINMEGHIQWYKTEVDVSALNYPADEAEVSFPILYNGKPAFTYKFKIKLQ